MGKEADNVELKNQLQFEFEKHALSHFDTKVGALV